MSKEFDPTMSPNGLLVIMPIQVSDADGFRKTSDHIGELEEESLKKNSAVLGLQGVSDDELLCMLKEGDLDGDGCLNQMEFCVLMFRLSPDLMNRATIVTEDKTLIVFDFRRISLEICKACEL
ncbi:hypothetical protein BUALT_Bualt03G0067700 [Buddleja alternifolia]|uniref:EF-hand domain-containing protein n=1 Tax=Buddleja alternifolia TaxID=168488 RepID=A0AAV6XZ13_9LAMI|nr:hypothetical protein BUALT_Bualt03G0067700 [Buddleja alternifolia]